MPQFAFTNRLMEKALRRAFLDGVMEIYEAPHQPRVYSITLEGTLSLLINKSEQYYIRIQETAERAQKLNPSLMPNLPHLHAKKLIGSIGSTSTVTVPETSGSTTSTPGDSISTMLKTSFGVKSQSHNVVVSVKTETDKAKSSTPATKTPAISIPMKPLPRILPKPVVALPTAPVIKTTVTVVHPKAPVIRTLAPKPSIDNCSPEVLPSADFSQIKVKSEPKDVNESVKIKIEPLEEEEEKQNVMVVQPEWIDEIGKTEGIKRERDDSDDGDSKDEQEGETESTRKKLKSNLSSPILAVDLPSSHESFYFHKNLVECPLCKETITNQKFLELHLDRHRKDFVDKCPVCAEGEHPMDVLLFHLTNCHGSGPQLQKATVSGVEDITPRIKPLESFYFHKNIVECPLCKEPISNQKFLQLHLDRHRKDFVDTCSVCKEGGYSLDVLLFHLTNFHTPGALKETDLSKAKRPQLVLASSTSVDSRAKIDPTKVVQVIMNSENQSSSSNSDNKAQESETSKTKDTDKVTDNEFQIEYACVVCGDGFNSRKELNFHHKSAHRENTGSYKCSVCSLSFDSLYLYQDHMLEHKKEDEKCKCQSCGKEFKEWKDLKQHLMEAHRKYYTCPKCKESFADIAAFQYHLAKECPKMDDNFECDMCDEVFTSAKSYNAHRRSHIDVKPHVCHICKSAFFKRGDMAKHMRTIHEPTKLYMCKICGRTGTRADNMRVHVRTHKKEISRDQVDLLLQKVDQ